MFYYFLKELLGILVVVGQFGVVVALVGVFVRVILLILNLVPKLLPFPLQHHEVEVAYLSSKLVPIEAVSPGLRLEIDTTKILGESIVLLLFDDLLGIK